MDCLISLLKGSASATTSRFQCLAFLAVAQICNQSYPEIQRHFVSRNGLAMIQTMLETLDSNERTLKRFVLFLLEKLLSPPKAEPFDPNAPEPIPLARPIVSLSLPTDVLADNPEILLSVLEGSLAGTLLKLSKASDDPLNSNNSINNSISVTSVGAVLSAIKSSRSQAVKNKLLELGFDNTLVQFGNRFMEVRQQKEQLRVQQRQRHQ